MQVSPFSLASHAPTCTECRILAPTIKHRLWKSQGPMSRVKENVTISPGQREKGPVTFLPTGYPALGYRVG